MHQAPLRYFLLYYAQDEVGGRDRDVDTQLLENLLVLGIVHAGNSTGHVEHLLGGLADNKIVFIVASDSYDHVGSAGARRLERDRLGPVALEDYGAEALAVGSNLLRALFYEQDFVAFVHEGLG